LEVREEEDLAIEEGEEQEDLGKKKIGRGLYIRVR
jgi:hypothetical protein